MAEMLSFFVSLGIFLSIVFSIFLLVLLIRFIWKVPSYLNDISTHLLMIYRKMYGNDDEDKFI